MLILSTHGTRPYHPDPTDYWRWTCEGLKKSLTDSGFVLVEFRGLMAAPSYAVQVWQDYAKGFILGLVRPLYFRLTQSLVELTDRVCPDSVRERDASVYLAAARPCGGNAAATTWMDGE